MSGFVVASCEALGIVNSTSTYYRNPAFTEYCETNHFVEPKRNGNSTTPRLHREGMNTKKKEEKETKGSFFLSFFSLLFLMCSAGLFCCVLVAFHSLYLDDELRLFGLPCYTVCMLCLSYPVLGQCSLRYTYNGTRRVRQLALGCESN